MSEPQRELKHWRPAYLLLDNMISNNLKNFSKNWDSLSLIFAKVTDIPNLLREQKRNKLFKSVADTDGILGLEYIQEDGTESLAIMYETIRDTQKATLTLNRLCAQYQSNNQNQHLNFPIVFKMAPEKKNQWMNKFLGLSDIAFNCRVNSCVNDQSNKKLKVNPQQSNDSKFSERNNDSFPLYSGKQ